MSQQLLAIFSPFGVVLELHFDLFTAKIALIVAAYQIVYCSTHYLAASWFLISAKAKQYSEFLLRLATRVSTSPYFSNIFLNYRSTSTRSAWVDMMRTFPSILVMKSLLVAYFSSERERSLRLGLDSLLSYMRL